MTNLPPGPDSGPPDERSVAASRLFSSRDVLVATLLGSVLAGSTLLALNYFALRRQGAALRTILVGAFAETAMFLAAIMLGDALPGGLLWCGLFVHAGIVVAMSVITRALQGRALSAQREAGGRVGAVWPSVVVGAGSMVTLGAVLVGALVVLPAMGPGASVHVGDLTIFYKNGITESEARRTGEFLSSNGLVGKDIDIRLRRVDGVPHIRFDTDASGAGGPFSAVGRAIAVHSFDGAAVVVDLATEDRGIHESIEVPAE